MIYVIVKDGIKVVGKEVYSGDDEASRASIDEARAANPNWSYEEIADAEEFNATELSASKQQTDWQVAKAAGTNAALSFLAKTLGLE